jgi:glycosyltransferase involved in cell wall biosynthesis
MSNPLVSIITPVYNGSKYIEELIQSVLEQDYPNIEHIIIDDGSTDNGKTIAILKRHSNIRWWTRPNRGQYSTMNEGLEAAQGEIITVICADDKYAEKKAITSVVQVFEKDPRIHAVYGKTIHIASDGSLYYMEGLRSTPIWLFPYTYAIAHCSLFVKKSIIIKNKLWFDEQALGSGDADWIIRMIHGGLRFKKIRNPIAMYRHHAEQISSQRSYDRAKEIEKYEVKYPVNRIVKYIIKRTITLVRIKNCYRRAGIGVLLQEGKKWVAKRFSGRVR